MEPVHHDSKTTDKPPTPYASELVTEDVEFGMTNRSTLSQQARTPLSQREILTLQRTIGNQAVMRTLAHGERSAARAPAIPSISAAPSSRGILQRSSTEQDGEQQQATDEAQAWQLLDEAWQSVEDAQPEHEDQMDESDEVVYGSDLEDEDQMDVNDEVVYDSDLEDEDVIAQNGAGRLVQTPRGILLLLDIGGQVIGYVVPPNRVREIAAELAEEGIRGKVVNPELRKVRIQTKRQVSSESDLLAASTSVVERFQAYSDLTAIANRLAKPVTVTMHPGSQADSNAGTIGRSGRVLQRAATVTGAMNHNAAQPNVGVVGNLANGTINWPNVRAVSNTSRGVDLDDGHRQPHGKGVGNVRPTDWLDFIGLIGGINPFKQGHSLHEDLAGDNGHDNLSPFTSSMNGLHYHRVEAKVLAHTEQAQSDEYADYDVTVNYGGNAALANWARNQFNGLTLKGKIAAMVSAGLITAGQGKTAKNNGALSAAQLATARTWVINYVNNTFPSSIDCYAIFMDDVGGGNFTATPQQHVNITNDF